MQNIVITYTSQVLKENLQTESLFCLLTVICSFSKKHMENYKNHRRLLHEISLTLLNVQ